MFIDFRETERVREGGRKEREREKHQSTASHMHPDRGSNLQGMCPGQGLNLPIFGVWDDTPTTRVTGPGSILLQKLTLKQPKPL